MYFDDVDNAIYKAVNLAIKGVTEDGKGYYNSLFNAEYEALDDDEKNHVCGIFLNEFSVGFKEFVDIVVEERLELIHK